MDVSGSVALQGQGDLFVLRAFANQETKCCPIARRQI